MVNPFEDPQGVFLALRNEEGQYSLWPQFCDIPGGWTVRFGPDTRQACLEHIERNWLDMRPASLIAGMDGS